MFDLDANKLCFVAISTKRSTINKKTLALNYYKTFFSSSNSRSRNKDSYSNRYREKIETTSLFFGIVLNRMQTNIFKQYELLDKKVVNTKFVSQDCCDFDKQRSLLSIKNNSRIFVNATFHSIDIVIDKNLWSKTLTSSLFEYSIVWFLFSITNFCQATKFDIKCNVRIKIKIVLLKEDRLCRD